MKKLGAGCLLCWVIAAVVAYYLKEPDSPTPPPVTKCLVTAAHLGEIEGYTCVYSDGQKDYALYIKDNYVASTAVVGDIVSLADTTGKIISVTNEEFVVDVDNISKIVPGVSGSPVTRQNVPIGFISGWNGKGGLRCIFY